MFVGSMVLEVHTEAPLEKNFIGVLFLETIYMLCFGVKLCFRLEAFLPSTQRQSQCPTSRIYLGSTQPITSEENNFIIILYQRHRHLESQKRFFSDNG
jgi:hypothetical protein